MAARQKRVSRPVPPPFARRLRTYSFDPSLSVVLETAVINLAVLEVPWEPLEAGPVGEYLEVVDVDPASGCFYAPVDLEDRHLLARDGLEPAEGDPRFHQQMVYAVAMTTIRHFEQALGRLALWSRRRVVDRRGQVVGTAYVQRLRVYPHALREANAYYSPEKKALLFGYFPATPRDPGSHLPGGTVFTCLSHDIIAHETTHALLDGLHRRFIEPSNPDVLAFHEAFADVVALFQHFTFPAVLRHQIQGTRGDLRSQNLLGKLAQQFGQATGRYGALRDALGDYDAATGEWRPRPSDATEIERVNEPHARGSLLVAAVFDAFLAIYRKRVEDLLRLASSGSGILRPGALHPDLVERLTEQATKSAQHVLRMCIRALDYCPPVDLTFGEYLRALITADQDAFPGDGHSYRLAMLEAFRRRGIYPRDLRSLTEESLCWQAPLPEAAQVQLDELFREVRTLACLRPELMFSRDREALSEVMRGDAATVHGWILPRAGGRRRAAVGAAAERAMGLCLDPDAPPSYSRRQGLPRVEVHSVRPARRVDADGWTRVELVVEITQRRWVDLERPGTGARAAERDRRRPGFWFRGGCTLLIDAMAQPPTVRYCIAKSVQSETRCGRQSDFVQEEGSLRATYFGARGGGRAFAEPFALLHRRFDTEAEP